MKKISNKKENLNQKVDKYIEEQCGGWKNKDVGYKKLRREVISGKIILSPAMKELFKTVEKIGRKTYN